MVKAKSCRRCRVRKQKCSADLGDGCSECLRAGTECSLLQRPIKWRRLEQLPAAEEIQVTAAPIGFDLELDRLLSKETIKVLVQNYLYYIHDRPHSLFHRKTLWRDIETGSLKSGLLYSICSLGSPFVQDPEVKLLRPRLTAASKRMLQIHMEDVCLQNVQTAILLANLCHADLQPHSEALYFGKRPSASEELANDAQVWPIVWHILKLHQRHLKDDPVLRETKSRVWWTLVMADRWCSTGLNIPCQLTNYDRTVDLPLDESYFQSLEEGCCEPAIPPGIGLWAYMIDLVEIFTSVHDLNKCLVEDRIDIESLEQSVSNLATRYNRWIEELPADVQMTDVNLETHIKKGLGGPFLALHLGYHHYCSLLFFQYLDLQRPKTAKTEIYARCCKHHAQSLSSLLQRSLEKGGCDAVYATAGHMAVVSSSVLLHTLQFGDEWELDTARERLSSNYVYLIKLKSYWPSLSIAVSVVHFLHSNGRIDNSQMNRLSTFQDACLRSKDPNTHKIDRWMVKFLLEYASPLAQRMTDPIGYCVESPHSISSIGAGHSSDEDTALRLTQ